MAEIIPAHVIGLVAILTTLLSGCTPDDATGKDTPGTAAEQPRQRKPEPPPKTPEEAIARIRRRCHSILEREGMANCSVLLRENEDDEIPEDVKLGADDCMSIRLVDRSKQILSETGKGWHVVPGEVPVIEPIEGAAHQKLKRLQRLLRTALLEPLYECEQAERKGPKTFTITTKRGEAWTLELREIDPPGSDQDPVLLPHTLSGPPGMVTFRDYLHTGVTHLPKRVVLGEFGTRWFSLELSGLSFSTTVFRDPKQKVEEPRTVRVETGGFALEPRIGEVGLKPVAAKTALVVPDPGTWKERFAVLNENGRKLAKQGQQTADLDFLFDEGGKRFLAMPFEQASEEFGGKPFVKTKDQRVLTLPAQQVAILYPKNGPLEKNEKLAVAQLAAFMKDNALRAAGPMRIIPWIEVDKPLPPERTLQRLRIGFEVPVANR